jgi:hypothetical protein
MPKTYTIKYSVTKRKTYTAEVEALGRDVHGIVADLAAGIMEGVEFNYINHTDILDSDTLDWNLEESCDDPPVMPDPLTR